MPLKVKKIEALDSVRGIAACIVVLGHFADVFFPSILIGSPQTVRTHFDLPIYQSPLSVFFASGFAVIMFFILSGFVLTLKYFSHHQSSLFPAALKRYVRLMPIVFVSILLGYGLMSFGLMFFAEVNKHAHLGVLVYPFAFEPNLLQAISQGLVGVFTSEANAATSYNPVLWTIYYELLGAFIIFGLATLSRDQPKRWLLYGAAIMAFANTFFCAFIVGLVLADLYASRPGFYQKIQNLASGYKFFLLILALSIAAYQPPAIGTATGPLWNALTLVNSDTTFSRRILQLTAGLILILLALGWTNFSRVLRIKPLRWLGKVSYALYAVHFIIIYSLTCGLFLLFNQHFGYTISALMAMGASLPIIFGLSHLLHIYVELPSIAAAGKVGRWSSKQL